MRIHPPRNPLSGPRASAPLSPREARARAATEVLLAAAVLVSVVLGVLRTTHGGEPALGPAQREAPGPPAASARPAPMWTSLPVDVARDGLSRLRLLPGIGPTRARAILLDRATQGPVRRVDDLLRIRGLGPRTVAALHRAGARVRDAP